MRRQPPPQPPQNQQQRQYHHLQKNNSGTTTTPVVPLYHSTVFRYSCKGRLKLDSRLTNTAGVCQGVQSQLQAVEHLRLGTKEEALNYFQQKSALGSIDGDHPHHSQPGGGVGQGSSGGGAEALQAAYMSNVLIYPNTNRNNNQDDNKKGRKFTPEENSTTEKWSCVGNTEVDLLVLRPQNAKEEEIVAVSPYCSPGMTTRDVNTPTLGRDRTSTMRLGFFEIVYVSSTIEDDDDEDYVDEVEEAPAIPDQQQHNQQQEISNKTNSTISQKEGAATATTNNNPKVPATRRRKSTKNPPKKEQKSMTTKIYTSGTNILNHMQINAKLLYQATQDDFANRTMSASKRIVSEFETTKNRTVGLMKKVLLWDFSRSSDDGGDNDGKGDKS